jgi:hypothetical protein
VSKLPITEELISRARALRHNGASWTDIRRELGIGDERLRRVMEPGFKERRNRDIRNARATRGYRGEPKMRLSPEETKLALATVPSDTRDLTSRLLGDPLPGRSALAKMRANAGAETRSRTVFHAIHVSPVEEWKKSVLGIAAQEPIRADRRVQGEVREEYR